MAIAVVMPQFESAMTEGTVVAWKKKVGDLVNKGDVLLRIETDTGERDVAAAEAGYLLRIDADIEQIVPCGDTVAWLGGKGEKI